MSEQDLSKLPLDTSLKDALLIAVKQGRYLRCGEGVSPRAPCRGGDPGAPETVLAWQKELADFWMNVATPEEIEEAAQCIASECPDIESLADLKRDIQSGNFAWRNSETGSEICRLGLTFDFITTEEYSRMMGFPQ